MRLEELNEWDKYEYTHKCPTCENIIKVFTQKDNYPEYYTDVFIQCYCGELLQFVLPVN